MYTVALILTLVSLLFSIQVNSLVASRHAASLDIACLLWQQCGQPIKVRRSEAARGRIPPKDTPFATTPSGEALFSDLNTLSERGRRTVSEALPTGFGTATVPKRWGGLGSGGRTPPKY